jgi:hypothetical protein
MASTGAPSLAQRGAPSLEVYDQLDEGGVGVTAAGAGRLLYVGLEPTPTPAGFWTAATGVNNIVDLGNGVKAWSLVGGAATVSKGCGQQWETPLSKKLGTAPLVGSMYRRFRTAALIWRDVLTGNAPLNFALNNQGDGRSLSDFNTIWGLEVRSDPLVFGGNWFCRKRLVTAGAITTFADSLLSPLVPRRIVFDYLEGAIRVLTVRVDGVQVYQESGDAALAFSYPGLAKGFAPAVSLGAGAGSTGFVRDVMYRVEWLSDPWAGL